MHERMSQGKVVKGFKEKKIVPGWSVEEMKEKPNIALKKTLKNEKMERSEKERNGPVVDKYKVEEGKRDAFRGRGAPLKWRRVRRNT